MVNGHGGCSNTGANRIIGLREQEQEQVQTGRSERQKAELGQRIDASLSVEALEGRRVRTLNNGSYTMQKLICQPTSGCR